MKLCARTTTIQVCPSVVQIWAQRRRLLCMVSKVELLQWKASNEQ